MLGQVGPLIWQAALLLPAAGGLLFARLPHLGSLQHIFGKLDPKLDTSSSRYLPAFPHHPSRLRTGFAALGDSYSAGIGTGLEGQEDECRRGHHAYPALILNDLNHFRGPNTTALQFLSCTGSSTEDLLLGGDRSQIDDLNGTELTDFAVLSVGGNDLGFFDVINSCIFRFYSFYSGTCEEALQRTDRLIQGTEFDERLQVAIMEILDKVQWEKQPWFTITTTGYARFFNADTEDCDQCSFGIWWHGPKLTRDIRQRMNDMVLAVNAKIRSSVAAINARFTKPRVLFVDYDAKFDGHRFCEPNITEPDYNRTDTWFFLVGGTDNELPNATESKMASGLRSDATAAHTHAALPPQSPLVNPTTCLGPARDSGDWGELALCYMAMAMERDPTLRLAPGELAVYNSMWYVPTYYGKTFHPRSRGHEVIRDEIYKVWAEAST